MNNFIFCNFKIDTNNDIEENFYYKLFWYFCHIIEIFGIAYSICRLRYNLNFYKHSRQIKDEYKISRELFIISIIWFFFDIANYIIFFIFKFTILGEYQYIIFEFVRNFCMILVSGLFPLMISFNSLNLPICTTKECASNFNLLLITEKTYDSFMNFLNKCSPDGSKLLLLWTELNVFKHSSRNPYKEVSILASEIYEKYLKENSENCINIPHSIIEKIQESYRISSKNIYHPVFDELLDYVFCALKDIYYPNFRISEDYKILEKELETDEIIYSRLVASSMISSIELE